MTPESNLRVCVFTTYRADAEPRAPRHAVELANINRKIEVTFIDCAPEGQPSYRLPMLEGYANLTWQTHFYQHKKGTIWKFILHRLKHRAARLVFNLFGAVWPCALSVNVIGLERLLREAAADVYIAHNIDALIPAGLITEKHRALLMFDCMEFYSDMGEKQSRTERRMIKNIEMKWLPKCALILASSDQVAGEYESTYKIQRPLALYNVPPIEKIIAGLNKKGFHLYWRNSVIGFGQRGLDEALIGLSLLPTEVTLHLQGHLAVDGGQELRRKIDELGLRKRVVIHPPYSPEMAVQEAAQHTVGLCLERRGNRNHDLTVSSKIFDYMMAGLAVVSSDLSGLSKVVNESGGGLVFDPGSSVDLADKIFQLYDNKDFLLELQSKSREFALVSGNLKVEMEKFTKSFVNVCSMKLN